MAKTTNTPRAQRAARRAAKAETAAPAPIAPALAAFPGLRHDAIRPDPANPRKLFDADGLAELAASIGADGLLEPVVVRPDPENPASYMLIAGERRWRAIGQAIFAGTWPADQLVPAVIRHADEAEARRLALVENLQRRDLNAIEEGRAVHALMELTGESAAQVGVSLGFSKRWAQQRLSLLELPETMQTRIDEGALKLEDARDAVGLMPKLSDAKRRELERGAITVAQARDWLAAQPQPLSDAAKLAIMELLEKVETAPYKPNDYTTQKGAKVAAVTTRTDRGENGVSIRTKIADPAYDELRQRHIIEEVRQVTVEGVETGEHYVSLSYSADYYLRDAFRSALDAKFRAATIPTLRVQLHGLQADYEAGKNGTYATPWLNAPEVELSAEITAEIEAKRKAREQRNAEIERERTDRDEAERRQRQHWIDLAKTAATKGEEIADAEASARPDMLQALAKDAGHPLPWRADEAGNIRNAEGGVVFAGGGYWMGPERAAGLQLIVAMANAGAGAKLPPAPAAGSREAFVAMVADLLLEDTDDDGEQTYTVHTSAEAASAALDAFLAQEEIEFGDADYDWADDGAGQLAHLILVEGFGQDAEPDGPPNGDLFDELPPIDAGPAFEVGQRVRINQGRRLDGKNRNGREGEIEKEGVTGYWYVKLDPAPRERSEKVALFAGADLVRVDAVDAPADEVDVASPQLLALAGVKPASA